MSQKEITKKVRKQLEMDENKCIIWEIFWNVVKAMLRQKFIAINSGVKKEKASNQQLASTI